MSNSKLTLYSYWQSSCSYRVRNALNLKQFSYETKTIDLNERSSDEYAALSPTKYVPALVTDGHTSIESIAIMHYSDEAFPDSYSLLPQDPIKRCSVREISEVIASGIQPMQNTGVIHQIDEAKKVEWARFWIVRGFDAIEKLLEASAGKYCVGDEITMADCCLAPQVYNARRRFNMDLSLYPNILRIAKELEDHPAFVAAHPSNQPDSPPDATK